MKTKIHLQFTTATRFFVLCITFLILGFSTIQAQKNSKPDGYGKAVYQGLQEDVFLKKWLLLGPISVSDKAGDIPDNEIRKNAFSLDLITHVSADKNNIIQPFEKSGRKYDWSFHESGSDTILLNRILGDSDYVYCYALAEIVVYEPITVLVGLGSDDAVKMWVNGKEVHNNYIDRSIIVDNDIFEISLEKGSNQLLIKIQNSALDYGFTFRQVSKKSIADLLLKSVANGDFDNVKTLLKYSPDLTRKDRSGLTAWQIATVKGRSEIADYLKENGAPVSTEFPSVNEYINNLYASLSKKEVPGIAILISKNGEVIFKGGYGMADIGNNVPVTAVTKFRIGSITKQFIASAILKLQEEGKLSVEDKLSKFIPDFPRGDEVTIHHLLTHTSGIHSFTSRADFLKTVTVKTTSEEMIDSIEKDAFDFNPGDEYRYNNSGFFILGAIIEKISGKAYGDYLKDAFFIPLGMKNTGVYASQLILQNEATGYAINNGAFEKALNWDMSRAGGAGSLYSTVEDLYLWNEAVFNGKVLNENSLNAAFTPVILNSGKKPAGTDYGYGWAINDMRNLKFINHAGGLHGFLSQIIRQPEEKMTVVVLTNCLPAQDYANPSQVAFELAEYLLWQKMSKQQSYVADTTFTEEQMKEFEGRFNYGNAMVLTVTAEKDKLFAQMTGQPRYQIFPRGNEEFYWKVVEARIKYMRNEKGEITHAIHYQGGVELNVTKMPEIRTIKVEQSVLEKYTGNYQYEPDMVITITAMDGRLFAQPANQNKTELFPVSEIEFVARDMDASVKFISNTENSYQMLVRIGNNEKTIDKVK